MGGTSCDVSVAFSGRAGVTGGRVVGGRALALPMVDVHTIGAGGGSVAWRDAGGALRVGPRSAGAHPAPACYGRGGDEPTVTDANLLLGYLDSDSPLAGGVALDRDAAGRAVARLGESLGLSTEDAAAGIVRVASTEMARAVRVMTVERGIDPRPLALLAFGGAGPLHACAIADELGMRRVVVPRASGVLSALGLVVSERRRELVRSELLTGPELTREAVGSAVAELAERGREELGSIDAEVRVRCDLRYAGQAFELTIPAEPKPDIEALRGAFDAAHERRYGYSEPDATLELVTLRVAVALPGGELTGGALGGPAERSARAMLFDSEWTEASVHRGAIERVQGPGVCELPEATLVVPPGWSGDADADGTLVLERG
jgi:N-methylhydantoinase A